MTTKTETVRLAAWLKAKPGEEAALAQALNQLALAVREEAGCIEYVPHAIAGAPGEFMFYEVWENQAALDAHAAGANLKTMEAPFARMLAEPAKLVFLQRLV